jgi:predicted nucleic acid-binding protein
VRFWDASALVPLFQLELQTPRVRDLLFEDPAVIVWALTRVELMSAIARRRRAEPQSGEHWLAARREIIESSKEWTEIATIETVREHAERVIVTHPLRAADALQLGAALVAAGGSSATLQFVTLDQRLAAAARGEGFPVLGPD